jgi:hypothetical protein
VKANKENQQECKAEEPSVIYDVPQLEFKGIDRATFNFDEEVKKGLTPEEFRAEIHKRIDDYPWKK